MSDAMLSALDGAQAQGLIDIREMGLQGMITLRADQAKAATLKKSSTSSSVSYKPRHTISQKSSCKDKEPTFKDVAKSKLSDAEPVE